MLPLGIPLKTYYYHWYHDQRIFLKFYHSEKTLTTKLRILLGPIIFQGPYGGYLRALWGYGEFRKWQVMIKNGLERINMDEIKR